MTLNGERITPASARGVASWIWAIALGIATLASGCHSSPNAPAAESAAKAEEPRDVSGRTSPGPMPGERYLLPNGWALFPAGRQIDLGGLPLKLTPHSDGRHVFVTTSGHTDNFLAVIDALEEKIVQRLPLKQAWLGLAVSTDGKNVFASTGSEDAIQVYRFADGRLTAAAPIKLPKGAFPAGLAINRTGERLFVVANLASALLVVDATRGEVLATIPVGQKPYTCVLSADERQVFVSNWGEDSVAVVDLSAGKVTQNVKVEDRPNDMLLASDGRLFVANGNRNTVSVIDAARGETIETIDVAVQPRSPPGSTPNALAATADGRRLYVASADNNALAVLDIEKKGRTAARGFIPTGWYPTAVCLVGAGKKLLIANGKGSVSKANAKEWSGDGDDSKNAGYIAKLLEGTLSFVDAPDDETLARYSEQVYRNTPSAAAKARSVAPPFELGKNCPIKHVVYIIKENRTYDQIFGDMKEGNGAKDYCLFPEEVTPNHHALAREFGLFDHFFHDAEVSADGHHWVTSAYATDYVEKFWPNMYAGRGNKERLDLHDDPIAFSRGGFIWDLCSHAGLSYRSYGEFARLRGAEKGKVKAAMPSLVGHIHETYFGADGISAMSDSKRFELWQEDFRSFEKQGEMPQFQVLSLPGDHTLGTRGKSQTTRAMLAENDLALGRIVAVISNSRFWSSTAIFVVEDDPQDGPDHVDCHRSIVLVVSPFCRRHAVDSTMYSTSSVLRTMELLLGLPPLTQYDEAATPMWPAFQNEPHLEPYRSLPARISIDERNSASAFGAARSLALNLDEADMAPDGEFNEIIWKSVKGADSPLPPRRVAAFVRGLRDDDD